MTGIIDCEQTSSCNLFLGPNVYGTSEVSEANEISISENFSVVGSGMISSILKS